jgi:hypothetical protein
VRCSIETEIVVQQQPELFPVPIFFWYSGVPITSFSVIIQKKLKGADAPLANHSHPQDAIERIHRIRIKKTRLPKKRGTFSVMYE